MTGYTVHTGASKKFVSGWDRIFGDSSADETGPKAAKKKSKSKKAAAKKKKKS